MKSQGKEVAPGGISQGPSNAPQELLILAQYPGIGKIIVVSSESTQEISFHDKRVPVDGYPDRITPWGIRRRLGLVEEYK
jgi:hypothetical protein